MQPAPAPARDERANLKIPADVNELIEKVIAYRTINGIKPRSKVGILRQWAQNELESYLPTAEAAA